MIYQDCILRLLEQFVKVLAKILFNKKMGNYRDAAENAETAFNHLLGLDYNLVSSLSAKDIVSLLNLSTDEMGISIKCIIAARLLKEHTELKSINNPDSPDVLPGYLKALRLYLEAILNNKNKDADLSEYYPEVKELAAKLGDDVPEDIESNLIKFHKLSNSDTSESKNTS